jgi:hypothetical protein
MTRRLGPLAAAVLMALAVSTACGRKKAEKAEHAHGSEDAAAVAVPTPDNTPIDVLRTPAGLVLKTEEPTPARAATPVPATVPPAETSPAPKATP